MEKKGAFKEIILLKRKITEIIKSFTDGCNYTTQMFFLKYFNKKHSVDLTNLLYYGVTGMGLSQKYQGTELYKYSSNECQ